MPLSADWLKKKSLNRVVLWIQKKDTSKILPIKAAYEGFCSRCFNPQKSEITSKLGELLPQAFSNCTSCKRKLVMNIITDVKMTYATFTFIKANVMVEAGCDQSVILLTIKYNEDSITLPTTGYLLADMVRENGCWCIEAIHDDATPSLPQLKTFSSLYDISRMTESNSTLVNLLALTTLCRNSSIRCLVLTQEISQPWLLSIQRLTVRPYVYVLNPRAKDLHQKIIQHPSSTFIIEWRSRLSLLKQLVSDVQDAADSLNCVLWVVAKSGPVEVDRLLKALPVDSFDLVLITGNCVEDTLPPDAPSVENRGQCDESSAKLVSTLKANLPGRAFRTFTSLMDLIEPTAGNAVGLLRLLTQFSSTFWSTFGVDDCKFSVHLWFHGSLLHQFYRWFLRHGMT